VQAREQAIQPGKDLQEDGEEAMNEESLFGPEPSKKPKPLPKAKPRVADRPLTPGERNRYKMIKGVWPREGMMLSEFRKFMGGFRSRGGFR
jgi:hypothetical protein